MRWEVLEEWSDNDERGAGYSMSDIFGFGFVMREKGEETNRKGDAKDIISCCMGLSKNPSHEITPGLFFCEI